MFEQNRNELKPVVGPQPNDGRIDPMATLKEFEDALRQQGMQMALAILETLKARDRAKRSAVAPARRLTGQKMTPELALRILELHGATKMTQQEIAFKVGVNQGRVNEVIKHGKWLDGDPKSVEAQSRDNRAVARIKAGPRATATGRRAMPGIDKRPAALLADAARTGSGQLTFL